MIAPAIEAQGLRVAAQALGAVEYFRQQPALLALVRRRIMSLVPDAGEFVFAHNGDHVLTQAGRWVPPSMQAATALWLAVHNRGKALPLAGSHRGAYMQLYRVLDSLARHDHTTAQALDFARGDDPGLRLQRDPAGRGVVWLRWSPPVRGLRLVASTLTALPSA